MNDESSPENLHLTVKQNIDVIDDWTEKYKSVFGWDLVLECQEMHVWAVFICQVVISHWTIVV